jgi:hypothetical protein
MSMSNRTRREVGKMRELLWFLLNGKVCCFCKKPLLPKPSRKVRFGNASGEPFEVDITQHHHDEDHSNNDPSNIRLAHTTCHKRHHAVIVFSEWRKKQRSGSRGLRGAA